MHKNQGEKHLHKCIYLLNTPILSAYGQYDFSGPLKKQDIIAYLENGFESAIGHASTAQFIEQLLDIAIPVKRQAVQLDIGDIAVVFRLTQRLPEGLVLDSIEAIQAFPYEFSLLKRLA